jgi:hypothetical protein
MSDDAKDGAAEFHELTDAQASVAVGIGAQKSVLRNRAALQLRGVDDVVVIFVGRAEKRERSGVPLLRGESAVLGRVDGIEGGLDLGGGGKRAGGG